MKLVLIEWEDSYHSTEWTYEDAPTKILTCQSVGWLSYDGKKVKTISPHITDDGQRCGCMTIPVRCIVRITTLAVQ